jgi:pimeloyl-ACP methyl ester carboxylesterase
LIKTVNGLKINYEEKGEGELIVLLHGWGSNITLFANLIDLLSKKYKVVAMDMPGFGKSEEPKEVWDVSSYVQFVIDFLKDYDAKEVMLLGHSFGGRVIIKMHSRNDLPFKVTKVILVDSAGIMPPKSNKKTWRTRYYKMGKTVLSWGKFAEQRWPASGERVGTSGSAGVYIHSSYVTFEDITFENTAGEGKEIGQAVAVFTDGDFLFFHRCRFLGNQDTLYTYGRFGKEGGVKRNYFLECYIEGTTDFIFGPSIAYFERCTLHSKKNSYVTAASTLPGQTYGYVFKDCRLTADPGIDKCYLGRPWGAYAKTVFIGCELGPHIVADGWHDWEKEGKPNTKKNSYYAEYQNVGPGAQGPRVKWAHTLTAKQAAEYTFEKVMYQAQDGIRWNPFDNR